MFPIFSDVISLLRCSNCLSSPFSSSWSCLTFSTTWLSDLTFKWFLILLNCVSISSRCKNAPLPVKASILLTPAPVPDSLTILKRPISAVLFTCIPPHNSIENGAILTTRTISPYFSPNKAIAPIDLASSILISWIRTSIALQISSFTLRSTKLISSCVIGPKCEKSKRSLSGSTNEPAWLTWSPNTSFNAACNKCVALWFFWISRLSSLLTRASTFAFCVASPNCTIPLCKFWPLGALVTSVTFISKLSLPTVPLSATCPPLTA